jgi:hypothetical protein
VAYLQYRTINKNHYLYGIIAHRNGKKVNHKHTLIGTIDIKNKTVLLNKQSDSWLSINNTTINDISIYLNNKKGISINSILLYNHDIDCEKQNIKKSINKLDNANNDLFDANNNAINMSEDDTFRTQDIINCSIENFGASYLLYFISEKIGLTKILKNVFNSTSNIILALAQHQLLEQEPYLYAKNFIKQNLHDINPQSVASQSISELSRQISNSQILDFYSQWCNYNSESEFLVVDITSISSYSEKIKDVAYGYNRDGEKLKQINLCMIFGEKSQLPMYSVQYHGSLSDVETFSSTADQFKALNDNNFKFVMDKGFYSLKNVDHMLKSKTNFLVAVPARQNNFKDIIKNNLDLENNINNTLIYSNDMLFYRTIDYNRYNNTLKLHLYLNTTDKHKERTSFIYRLKEMHKSALKNPNKYYEDSEYKKFLNFKKINDRDNQFIVTIKDDVIDKTFHMAG